MYFSTIRLFETQKQPPEVLYERSYSWKFRESLFKNLHINALFY